MSQNLTEPKKGAMYLFDYVTPPLEPGPYRMEVSTTVGYDATTKVLDDKKYFEVVGPRFSLDASEVAGVVPPRNGRGPFQATLAQIVIKRRTLPWERKIGTIPPAQVTNPLPPGYPVPWVTVLLFEDGEYELLENVPLENVVSQTVFDKLGKPANVLCTAVEADVSLVKGMMPSVEELQLLSHVRWVNIDDRELNVEGSNGWFSVVMTSRLPKPGAKCRACLVSLEGRTDLVKAELPETMLPQTEPNPRMPAMDMRLGDVKAGLPYYLLESQMPPVWGTIIAAPIAKTRLVVLHSWQFTCEGEGTFYDLMQGLDVALMGKVDEAGKPAITDTAHLRFPHKDRSGVDETVWYRGPLAPFELTRDTLGPYHSADQCRRAAPETGAEDISYAAAFEVGRLLAASDARLAQELMKWRREQYKQSARATVISELQNAVALDIPVVMAEKLHSPLVPIVATAALQQLVDGAGPVADVYGIGVAGKTIGMDPKTVQDVWGLPSVEEAQAILGANPGTLGLEAPVVKQTVHDNTTLSKEVADTASLDSLKDMRNRLIDNVVVKLGGQ